MTTQEAIKQRKSVRAFLDKPIKKEILEQIIEIAKFYPSSTNIQPVNLVVVSKEAKKNLDNLICKAYEDGEKPQKEYDNLPNKMPEIYAQRRIELGKKLYGFLQIPKDDKVTMKEQWKNNYKAFNAPSVIYFLLDKNLQSGSFLDLGILVQNIALLALEFGLSTCIQGSLAQYPNIVKQQLNISENYIIVYAIAIGYEDKNAKINQFRSNRIKLDEFCKFYE